MVNVWLFVDKLINANKMKSKRGDICSISSAYRRNMERSIQSLTRKRIGRRCDLVIRDKAGLEYACGEAGHENEDFDTKVIVEFNLKAPKVMHDMFVAFLKRVDYDEEAIGKIRVVGFLFSRLKIRLLVMDRPVGYTCRLRTTAEVGFTGNEETLAQEFVQTYKLVWKGKEICLSTQRIINQYRASRDVEFEDDQYNDKQILLPCSLGSPMAD